MVSSWGGDMDNVAEGIWNPEYFLECKSSDEWISEHSPSYMWDPK